MKQCKYCKSLIETENNFCPLCFNHLQNVDDKYDQLYTLRRVNETTNITKNFLVKLFLFLTICAVTICFVINILSSPDVHWFWIVFFGLGYVWVLVAHTILSKHSAVKKILLQVISIILLLYFTERISTTTWLLPFVYPSVSFTAVSVLLMITFINSNRSDYILGFTVIIFLMGLTSGVLVGFNFVEYKFLNIINIIICLLSFLGMLIFGMQSIKQDLSKKLHL